MDLGVWHVCTFFTIIWPVKIKPPSILQLLALSNVQLRTDCATGPPNLSSVCEQGAGHFAMDSMHFCKSMQRQNAPSWLHRTSCTWTCRNRAFLQDTPIHTQKKKQLVCSLLQGCSRLPWPPLSFTATGKLILDQRFHEARHVTGLFLYTPHSTLN